MYTDRPCFKINVATLLLTIGVGVAFLTIGVQFVNQQIFLEMCCHLCDRIYTRFGVIIGYFWTLLNNS
jgi:disulfide bond formation protein DsbB